MRPDSAATAKEQRSQSTHIVPSEGTRLRRLYDLFMASKGIPIEVRPRYFERIRGGRLIDDLQDFYGLDIRKIENGRWVLAGEWFGPTYRDYIADRIHAFDRARAE